MAEESDRSTLVEGERVLLIDAKDRRYLLTLRAGASFHTHAGIVQHDDVIGHPEGSAVVGSTGRQFLVLRPTLTDVVLKMPRGAQVIYPKDLGAILMAADIGPGQLVVEAGVGSGALSMAVLRAGASVVGYEIRPEFAERAQANVHAALGPDVPYRVVIADVTDGIAERDVDRVLLDLPEPWRVVGPAARALRPGGIFFSYLPTVNQTAQLRAALDAGPFGLAETVEVLRRTWHVEPRSVRPDHRMVAHTGFLTTARRLAGPVPAECPERPSATPFVRDVGQDERDEPGGPDAPGGTDTQDVTGGSPATGVSPAR